MSLIVPKLDEKDHQKETKEDCTSLITCMFVGVEIVRIRAEDADYGQNAAIDYSIVSGAQNTFDIDVNTGVISRRAGAVLDFDVTPAYTLMVRCVWTLCSAHTVCVCDLYSQNSEARNVHGSQYPFLFLLCTYLFLFFKWSKFHYRVIVKVRM